MQWGFCRQDDSFEIFVKLNFLGLANFCFNCTLEAALNTPSERSKIPDYISLCERTWPGLVRDNFQSETEERECRLPTCLQFPGDLESHKQHLLVNKLEERSFSFRCWVNYSQCILHFLHVTAKQFVFFLNLLFIFLRQIVLSFIS